jgi:methionyl-tRNA formyltransferase
MTQTSSPMQNSGKSVVFFGSGPVAARCLELLLKHTEVEAVITKPRAEHHRGAVPVLELAENRNLTVFQPSNKRELSDLFATKPVQSQLGIVIDYGIIIAKDVIDYFPLGIINSHFSLLPQWRGADPITFAILSGQEKTGVSLMLIDEGMDTGDLLLQSPYNIPKTCTTPELTDALIGISDLDLQKMIPLWRNKEISPVPQETLIADSAGPTYSRKLTKDDGIIDWNKPAEQIEREVRAFTEWPKSHTKFGNISVVITATGVDHQQRPIGLISVENKRLFVGCGMGSLEILKLKPAGKNEMTAAAFIAGYGQKLH